MHLLRESRFILPAAHGTLYPSNNTAGVSFLLRHTFSIFPLLSWFSEDERDNFIMHEIRGKCCKSIIQMRVKVIVIVFGLEHNNSA